MANERKAKASRVALMTVCSLTCQCCSTAEGHAPAPPTLGGVAYRAMHEPDKHPAGCEQNGPAKCSNAQVGHPILLRGQVHVVRVAQVKARLQCQRVRPCLPSVMRWAVHCARTLNSPSDARQLRYMKYVVVLRGRVSVPGPRCGRRRSATGAPAAHLYVATPSMRKTLGGAHV